MYADIDIAARWLVNLYDDVKPWERYLNHCWCAAIKDNHDRGQLSPQQLDHCVNVQEKIQNKLMLFKRFPPEKYFRRQVVNYKKLLNGLKEKTVFILHVCEDWLKDDKNNFHEQIEFFESLKSDHLGMQIRDPEANFIIIDYDLNRYLLKQLNTPNKCCIHYVEKNVLLSTDCHEEFMRTVPTYAMRELLYWNLNLRENEIHHCYQNFIKKYPSRIVSKIELENELDIIHSTRVLSTSSASSGSRGFCDFMFHKMATNERSCFTFYDIMSALSITSLGNSCSVQRRLQSIWKIFCTTPRNGIHFNELVQCLESVGAWIQSQESTNSSEVRRLVTNLFEQSNKNPNVDELSRDEFIHSCLLNLNGIGNIFAPGFTCPLNRPPDVRWSASGDVIIEGLSSWPAGLAIDQQTGRIFVADTKNNRIVSWKQGEQGISEVVQNIEDPINILIDKENNSLIIADKKHRRVIRWSLQRDDNQSETIIDDIDCLGLTMDYEGVLYVSDTTKKEVRRYPKGNIIGELVAGGNGFGNGLDQFSVPYYITVDGEGAVYVADTYNHRIVKWDRGAKEGTIVAGFEGQGSKNTQLNVPRSVSIDTNDTLYLVDTFNNRVVRYRKNVTTADILVDQLNCPLAVAFDSQNNLYVTEERGRVLRFNIID